MERLPGFEGVVSSFGQNSDEWQEWYLGNQPETDPLIGKTKFIFLSYSVIIFC